MALSFHAWLMEIACPPPSEGEPGYEFYAAWGYEQWLIKTHKTDFERAAITMRPLYNGYLASQHLTGDTPEAMLAGKPLVRATRALCQFPMTFVPLGMAGVLVFEDAEQGAMCLFPAVGGAFFNFVPADAFERLDAVYTNDSALLDLQDGHHPATPQQLNRRFCTVPGVNDGKPIYVGAVYAASIGNPWHVDLHWFDAAQFRTKTGYRTPGAKYNGFHAKGSQQAWFQWNAADAARLQAAEIIDF